MKTYEICETVKHYHSISVDDEVDIESLMAQTKANLHRCDTAYESIEEILCKLQKQYGFEYKIKPNYCGTEIENVEVVQEID